MQTPFKRGDVIECSCSCCAEHGYPLAIITEVGKDWVRAINLRELKEGKYFNPRLRLVTHADGI